MEAIATDKEKIFVTDTPILLLINDESGVCYYSYRFRDDIEINEQLISGALIAITQLMEVALNQASNSLTQLVIDNVEVEIMRFEKMHICCFYDSPARIGPLFNVASILCATEVWQSIQREEQINDDDKVEIDAILAELYTIDYAF